MQHALVTRLALSSRDRAANLERFRRYVADLPRNALPVRVQEVTTLDAAGSFAVSVASDMVDAINEPVDEPEAIERAENEGLAVTGYGRAIDSLLDAQ